MRSLHEGKYSKEQILNASSWVEHMLNSVSINNYNSNLARRFMSLKDIGDVEELYESLAPKQFDKHGQYPRPERTDKKKFELKIVKTEKL